MTEYAQDYERLGPNPLVRDALIRATFDPRRALDTQVESLFLYDPSNPDKYNLSESVEVPIRAHAFGGSAKSNIEWYMDINVTGTRKLSIRTKPLPGAESSVEGSVNVRVSEVAVAGEALLLQDRYIGMVAHSHPNGGPPSPVDLAPLLYDDESLGAVTAAWAMTDTRNWIVFRGPNTPELSEAEANAKAVMWKSGILDRIRAHTSPVMSLSEAASVSLRVQIAFLRQAAERYDFQVFVGESGLAELVRLER